MSAPVIQSIDSLKQLPVFPDDSTVSLLPRLRRYNLLYGFNGCGKTTLARVFACLGRGQRHEEWTNDSTFTVTLTDGTQIKPESSDTALAERILVFNTDFIAQKFRWKEGEANPIFYLGQDQMELSENVKIKAEYVALLDGRVRRVDSIRSQSDQAFTQHKRDRARLIESEIGLGRRYNATNLASDYESYTYNKADLLDDENLNAQRRVLKQDNPLPKLSRVSEQSLKLSDMISDVQNLLQTTLGMISIETLREHDEMLPWVKDGLEYHKTHELKSCLFCGNPLTDKRFRMLEATIDDRYDELINNISDAKQTAETSRDTLTQLESTLPSKNDIINDQQTRFTNAATSLRSSIVDGRKYIERAINYLTKKQETPNSKIASEDLPKVSNTDKWMDTYVANASEVNKVIDAHNKANDNFTSSQTTAKDILKKHYLAEEYDTFCKLESNLEKAERVHNALQTRRNVLTDEIDNLKRQMRKHGPAADRVNTMIHKYLGHKELEIAAKDEGYEIRRNGKVTTAAPSEGEKTAIALSYFLVLLEADGRKREDLIVVMDDPISSLDTRSLNYACSLIRSLNSVAQLFILTHNAHIMNEIKKWLKNHTEKEKAKVGKNKNDATATLMFIDTIQPGGKDSRKSIIIELPKHLREYESEYHYLFHMMLRFLNSKNDEANYFFVMPNVMRKILEVFLSFKRPGSDGLSSKIENLAQQAKEIDVDELRIRALERLAHVESHGDSIDDLVTASSITIEEVRDAGNTLLELIEKLDSEHSRLMRKQCRTPAG